MVITLLVSVLAVVAAYPLAYFLAFVARKRRYTLLLLILAPFFTSYLLRVIAWKVILANNGVINSALWAARHPRAGDGIPWLIYSWFAVALVLFYSWVPFVALPIYVVLENMDTRLLEAAQDLAGRLRTFFRVTLPLSSPGVIAAFVFVLIPTTGEFIAPLLVAGPRATCSELDPGVLLRHSELELRGCPRRVADRRRARARAPVRPLPLHRPARGEGDRVSSVAASKTGGRVLGGYFVLLAIFLYAPLAVMIIFAFDDSFVQTFPWSASRRSGSTTPSRTRN